MPTPDPLAPEALRWRCDATELEFETTAEVPPMIGFAGQDAAIEALRFGIECDAPEQNVFVRGLTGTGRMSIVRRLLDEMRLDCGTAHDFAYVHDFKAPDRPSLLRLPAGHGRLLRREVRRLAQFVREDLPKLLTGEAIESRRQTIEAASAKRVQEITQPFDAALREAGLTMVQQNQGQTAQTAIVPLFDGKPLGSAEMNALVAEGKLDDARVDEWRTKVPEFAKRLSDVSREIQHLRVETGRELLGLMEGAARELLEEAAAPVVQGFAAAEPAVETFVASLVDDVVEGLGVASPAGVDPTALYDVNVVHSVEDASHTPVVVETTPSLIKLLGSVETGWTPQGPVRGDFRNISAGSLLRANGGYLVLEARDLLNEPGAWRVLVRTLRTKQLEIVPQELSVPYLRATIKPEPIPLRVRVILVGDAGVFHMLDQADPDFGHLFKVLADFESEIPRALDGVRQYAGVVARIAEEERLAPFDRDAIAALAEHGARIVARKGKMTARFARIADIAREAAYLAGKRGADAVVGRSDVEDTVHRTKARANLASRRFQAMIAGRTIVIETTGRVVGQVNGLAVIQAGMLTYGFPARITATIAPGHAGIIDIEAGASLSGRIHTKGFHILGGLLRHILRSDHALAFSASLAFEQSYGGIDGDSASGAEMCCLLSALTGIPLRQDVAITGAIDQHGRIQAIGGVNEKIEGFYDAAVELGLSGEGGVIVPSSNAGDLMLRPDVVEACAEGRFHVWAVDTVQEALAVFTGCEVGVPDGDGRYPEGTLLGIAQERARHFWETSLTSPAAYARAREGGDAPEA
ncbi:MAG: ATP-binding protein [Planctomycetota bacterium]